MRHRLHLAWVACCLALSGCGDSDTTPPEPDPLVVPEGCNPLASDVDCLLPFPSDFYRTDGEGGVRVRISEAALPKFEDVPVDILALHRPDGYSVGTPIMAVLGAAVDDSSLVFWTDDVERSLTNDSPTLLVDAETGEPVPHFAELDPRATDPARQALILRPLVRLEGGRRYVVAVHGVASTEGAVIEAPRGFASLRDEAGKAHALLEAMSAHYEADVFPLVEALGVERADLQLAWDFTTRTDDDAMGDMLAIIQDIESRWSEADPEVTVVGVEDDVSEHIARRVELTLTIPLYISSTEPGATLNGSPPVATESVEVPVTVWIPPSVMNRAPTDPPARLLQFGHGFFGTRYESDDFPAAFADAHGFVVVGADWWGMAEPDRGFVAGELTTDPGNVLVFTDRLHQAMANFLTLAFAARGPIATLPELDIAGTPAYAASELYFYGISNGHILGLSYAALAGEMIDRGAFGVGGANYSIMIFRARPFQPFLALLQAQMPDPLDHQKYAALAQSIFDRVDPVSYASRPVSPMLMQVGIADAQVPNLGTYFAAKIYGMSFLEGTGDHFPSWLDTTTSPADAGTLTPFDFGFEATYDAAPGETNDVHDEVRWVEASQTQISDFFQPDGVVTNTCDATCDPE